MNFIYDPSNSPIDMKKVINQNNPRKLLIIIMTNFQFIIVQLLLKKQYKIKINH